MKKDKFNAAQAPDLPPADVDPVELPENAFRQL